MKQQIWVPISSKRGKFHLWFLFNPELEKKLPPIQWLASFLPIMNALG